MSLIITRGYGRGGSGTGSNVYYTPPLSVDILGSEDLSVSMTSQSLGVSMVSTEAGVNVDDSDVSVNVQDGQLRVRVMNDG